ncbi:hypothetical protein [Emticicia sp. TH156]|nr:hypothetical protein [Emticicia sp. TH156]
MKAKVLILFLLAGALMASCRRQQCPAYGKTTPKSVAEKSHC